MRMNIKFCVSFSLLLFHFIFSFQLFAIIFAIDLFSLLIAFLLGYLSRTDYNILSKLTQLDFVVIGNIIPGLIANWMDRQGILRTVSVVLIVASIVNLIMMYIYYLDQFRILYV